MKQRECKFSQEEEEDSHILQVAEENSKLNVWTGEGERVLLHSISLLLCGHIINDLL